MKILFISDTHSKHHRFNFPSADMIVHAGDFTRKGTKEEVQDFLTWYQKLDFEHKILIGGNHDFFLEHHSAAFRQMLPKNIHYLEDEGITIEGIKFWGSPITPFFMDYAFNRQRGKEIRAYWDKIPTDVDVLVTHGPPYRILDKTLLQMHVGCRELLSAVQDRIHPKIHVFGHIHEAYGQVKEGNTLFINASALKFKGFGTNSPIIADI
ncbi:MAG: metallophosphatase domain-containing protein [Saprospiraceae bacterium]|jgi:Icc-related predicted phosphoesterase|nr:metallophosphatase domain-containing protein [Saprospiraceae bacterium]